MSKKKKTWQRECSHSTVRFTLRNNISLKKVGKPSLQVYETKVVPNCGLPNRRGLWSPNKAVALTRKDTGLISPCPCSRIRQQPRGPVSTTKPTPGFLSKPDCLVPIWSAKRCTCCKEKRHLVGFAASCSCGCHSQAHLPSFPAVFPP